MAQYKVTHSCGHEVTHQLFGKHSGFGGRDEKIDWLATQPCMECKRAEEAAYRANQTAEAAQANHRMGLPALLGSEKQTAWAETIRYQTLTSLNAAAARVKTFPEPNLLVEYAINGTLDWIATQLEAKWWIETIGTLKSKSGMAPIFAMLDGHLPKASEKEILQHIMLESPHCSAEVAEALGIGEEYRGRIADRAAAAAKTELREELNKQRPVRPAVLEELRRQHGGKYYWNGKIYSGRRIFVSENQVNLSPEQEKEILDYQKAKQVWLELQKTLSL